MSKKIIAGLGVVAGLAVALAPTASFADSKNSYTSDEHTDAFSIRVKDTCAFGNDDSTSPVTGVGHNTGGSGSYDSQATWAAGTPTTDAPSPATGASNTGRRPDNANGYYNVETDTASYAIEAGTEKAGFATTTLRVYCNNASDAKYTLTVTMDNLSETGGAHINANPSYSAAASGYAIDSIVAQGTGDTAAHGTVASAFASKWGTASTETPVATSSTGTVATGDEYLVTYGIGVQANQKAATYTGNVLYKLYQGLDS